MTTETNLTTVDKVLDRETSIKELVEKFGVTELQATVAWMVAVGDDITTACDKVYKTHPSKQAGDLMSMWKFRECLDHLSAPDYIETRFKQMKLTLLHKGLTKLNSMKNDTGWVGLYKVLFAMAFGDDLPDTGAEFEKTMQKLTDHHKKYEAAKDRVQKNLEKDKEESIIN